MSNVTMGSDSIPIKTSNSSPKMRVQLVFRDGTVRTELAYGLSMREEDIKVRLINCDLFVDKENLDKLDVAMVDSYNTPSSTTKLKDQ